jgi:hypothetical protein
MFPELSEPNWDVFNNMHQNIRESGKTSFNKDVNDHDTMSFGKQYSNY